ncbi:MAG: DUF5343 domain-containing protein [Devosia sp.]
MADEEEVTVPAVETTETSAPRPRRRPRPAMPATTADTDVEVKEVTAAEPARRKIPGNIPYTVSPGVLKRVLDRIPQAEKPPIFSTDFLATVLEASGGAARPIIPIMKATQMLNQGGIPTELYSQFQTEGGRAQAALQAMRNGFPEIFRRNSYAHNASDGALVDILVAITGLTKSDRILRLMLQTFQCFQDYAKGAKLEQPSTDIPSEQVGDGGEARNHVPPEQGKGLQLAYNINVVLPETTNIEVFNAIFKSLKGNLLN